MLNENEPRCSIELLLSHLLLLLELPYPEGLTRALATARNAFDS